MDRDETKDSVIRILSDRRVRRSGMHIKKIVEAIQADNLFSANYSAEEVKAFTKSVLDENSKAGGAFERIVNPKTKSIKPGYYRIRKSDSKRRPLPTPPADAQEDEQPSAEVVTPRKPTTSFIGKAGEYAVMSELLFRGFNANNMSVDDGIDIIASKDNNFYFIQVKTVTLKPNRTAIAQIKLKNFDKFINQQIRYVIAVKCDREIRFFTLANDHIRQLQFKKALSVSDKTDRFSIKIRYDSDGTPYFYDIKEEDATFWEGFERISGCL